VLKPVSNRKPAMLAGTAKINITPAGTVWMDGMIRAHPSEGIHDPLTARALVLANSSQPREMLALITADCCALGCEDSAQACANIATVTGLPPDHIIIAPSHTHSGPATIGFFNPKENEYTAWLLAKLPGLVAAAIANLKPVCIGWGAGQETTISHYRRLLADDGQVVMNWEPFPPERIVRVLGEADPEVGVVRIAATGTVQTTLSVLFNHAGHPNVMSGDNYLLSAEYPGAACRQLERQGYGAALFLNGAQGSVDIQACDHAGWEGVAKAGEALAKVAADTAGTISPNADSRLHITSASYVVPGRIITDDEWRWAQTILAQTGGKVQTLADGVGDDYLAVLYQDIHESSIEEIAVSQIAFSLGEIAFISFPGELYTEIGAQIKAQSPFKSTYIIGLANGYVGYIPTAQAIREGGYAEDTRRVDASATDIIITKSLELLGQLKYQDKE
jgi:neutral ceramidase